jgi:hypothetical protein
VRWLPTAPIWPLTSTSLRTWARTRTRLAEEVNIATSALLNSSTSSILVVTTVLLLDALPENRHVEDDAVVFSSAAGRRHAVWRRQVSNAYSITPAVARPPNHFKGL